MPIKSKLKQPKAASLIPAEIITRSILFIRGQKVMFDENLAQLYGVTTKRLNEQAKRNRDRFPKDFMFQLNQKEWDIWKSQFVIPKNELVRSQFATSKPRSGGRRYAPYVFTEQGIAMLSSVLNSKRAVQVNIEIMRTFVRLRQILATHEQLAKKLQALENKYDRRFKIIFDVIHQLMAPPKLPSKPIGSEDRQKRK